MIYMRKKNIVWAVLTIALALSLTLKAGQHIQQNDNVSELNNDAGYQDSSDVDGDIATHTAIPGAHHAQAHEIGGADHTQSTLAELNGKISDATLDDSSDQRTPTSHDNTYHSATYIEASGVTYGALDGNGDVGTGSDQVAQGSHTHDNRKNLSWTTGTIAPGGNETGSQALAAQATVQEVAITANSANANDVALYFYEDAGMTVLAWQHGGGATKHDLTVGTRWQYNVAWGYVGPTTVYWKLVNDNGNDDASNSSTFTVEVYADKSY